MKIPETCASKTVPLHHQKRSNIRMVVRVIYVMQLMRLSGCNQVVGVLSLNPKIDVIEKKTSRLFRKKTLPLKLIKSCKKNSNSDTLTRSRPWFCRNTRNFINPAVEYKIIKYITHLYIALLVLDPPSEHSAGLFPSPSREITAGKGCRMD